MYANICSHRHMLIMQESGVWCNLLELSHHYEKEVDQCNQQDILMCGKQ